QVGVRNKTAVIYTAENAVFISRKIAEQVPNAVSFGWSSFRRMKNDHDLHALVGIGRNPNLGAVLLLGSENTGIAVSKVADGISKSGKTVEILDVSKLSGTRDGIEKGVRIAKKLARGISQIRKSQHDASLLTVGVKCGGSDATSALTANPVVGLVSDDVIDCGGKILSSELTEMTGCDEAIRRRAKNQKVANQVISRIHDADGEFEARFGEDHSMMSPGNILGGLTTIEEKSYGAFMKTGHRGLEDLLDPGEYPSKSGWYVVDGLVAKSIRHYGLEADGEPTDFAAAGAQITFFTTGRGSANGNLIAPLIKVCANPLTFKTMPGDMDFNAGAILEGSITQELAAKKLFDLLLRTASGKETKSELLGHEEGGIIFGGRSTAIVERSIRIPAE
ncbi:MAG: UxaA family hydrolase, partial [Thaumarchaeota archaeon]|nr:UxaA family hydrolase [Nitrososphaerota archaeon]